MAKVNGIRIQKVLSENGVMSRRKAEEAIAQGRVTVNGHPAQPGNPVDPARDVIAIDGVRVQLRKKKQNVYIMLHKPRGFVTTTSDELGRRCVTDLVKDAPAHVYPVGRLDRNSEGLLLLTNDGAFANLVMHPSNHISKTYRVTVRPDVSDEQAAKMSAGVMLDGRMTLPATVLVLEKQDGRVVLQITIQEGRNRQVRRMCEAVGLEVARLKRTSVGPLKLGMLQPGQWRELRPGEVATPHVHRIMEENFYVLKGKLQVEINGVTTIVEEGQMFHIEPGEFHKVSNPTDEYNEYIIACAPFADGDKYLTE